MLAFEPPDWRALLGGGRARRPSAASSPATSPGSRRVRAGSARDYFLGFSAVNGFGDIWKAGGKVVKNVTGYDMCKLQAGAYGTLSALTELTLKVMPKPETACTIVLHGLADESAIADAGAGARIRRSRFPARRICRLRGAPFEGRRGRGGAWARRPLCAWKARGLRSPIAPTRSKRWSGAARVSTTRKREPSGRRSARFSRCSNRARASSGGSVRRRAAPRRSRSTILPALPSAEFYFDWGGGLIWLSLDAGRGRARRWRCRSSGRR